MILYNSEQNNAPAGLTASTMHPLLCAWCTWVLAPPTRLEFACGLEAGVAVRGAHR